MIDIHKILIAEMLDLAGEEFSNHGCNDLDPELFADWTEDQKIQAAIDDLGDSLVMFWLAEKIRKEL